MLSADLPRHFATDTNDEVVQVTSVSTAQIHSADESQSVDVSETADFGELQEGGFTNELVDWADPNDEISDKQVGRNI